MSSMMKIYNNELLDEEDSVSSSTGNLTQSVDYYLGMRHFAIQYSTAWLNSDSMSAQPRGHCCIAQQQAEQNLQSPPLPTTLSVLRLHAAFFLVLLFAW
jgi:hypothetical protein